MGFSRVLIALPVIGLVIGGASQDQTPAISSTKPNVFEVVSIRPSDPGAEGGTTENLPDGFRDVNVRLSTLVEDAYDIINANQIVRINQIIGMPSWAKSEGYDVRAKVDANTAEAWKALTVMERWKQEQPMLQAALADRCKLKVHFETKELPTYELVIATGGLKMKEATPDEKNTGSFSDGEFSAHAMSIANLVYALPADGRLIVDKTGLGDKKFDFDLKWTPEDRRTGVDSGPSLFTALEEQLGLKLVSSKAPGKVLVIDHMEKPSPN